MVELLVSKNVLSEILYENKTFKHALNDQCFSKKEYVSYKKVVSGLVGCELRHHFLFKKVLDKTHLEFNLDERTYLYLALANNHYLKALDIKEVNKYLEDLFNEKYSQIEKILTPEYSLFDYLDVDKKSFDYLSIRYNLPKWLLKAWSKEIGLSKTYRVIRELAKPANLTYRLNPYNEHAKDLLDKHKNIFGKKVCYEVVEIPRKLLRENHDLKGDHLFEIDYHLKQLVDEVQSELLEEVCIYSDEDDSLVLEELARSKHKLGVNVVCPSYEERTKLVRSIRNQKAKNINVFKADDVVSMKTGISRRTELFYCFPKSSSYTLINKYPDYIVRFRNTSIDEFVNNQKKALNNCAEFICDGGELIYLVNTLNYRETKGIIDSFLQSHPSFKLIKVNQIIPDKTSSTFLYYAVLRSEMKNE